MGWKAKGNLKLIEPLGLFRVFLAILLACRACITDSGGVSREAFFARRPCIIPMQNSWWPEIIQAGWAMETGRGLQRPGGCNRHVPAVPRSTRWHVRRRRQLPRGSLPKWPDCAGSTREPAWHPHGSWDLLAEGRAYGLHVYCLLRDAQSPASAKATASPPSPKRPRYSKRGQPFRV